MSLESFNRPQKPKEEIPPVQEIMVGNALELRKNLDTAENKIVDAYTKARGHAPFATKEQYRAAHPPLQPGEELDAEIRIGDIQAMSREERKVAVPALKEQYAYQKEGLAKIEAELIKRIRIDPDAGFKELNKILYKEGKKYGINEEQLFDARLYIRQYEKKHAAVHSTREEFPNDVTLFHHLFDRVPKGKVEIIEGPMTFYVRCFDPEDYSYIYSQAYIQDIKITPELVKQAQASGGVSLVSSRDPALQGTITAENTSFIENNKEMLPLDKIAYSEAIRTHEEQHAIKKLFGKEHVSYSAHLTEEESLEFREGDEEAKLRISRRILEKMRDVYAEDRARDEILAYYSGGTPLNNAYEYLIQSKENHGLYDYLYGAALTPLVNEVSEEFIKKLKKLEKMVLVDEYHVLLRRSMLAVTVLEAGGYSREKVIALLQHEPLSKWTKVAKRQLG